MKIDATHHTPGFCLASETTVHVIEDDGTMASLPLAGVAADTVPHLQEGHDGRAQVFETVDGRWGLVRDYEPDLLLFANRGELGHFLWNDVAEDATALRTLLQLGMLQFEANAQS